jgi:sterol desaturase/sphingolipid hydroxylase (fatty acid hydroxylase superfamily)
MEALIVIALVVAAYAGLCLHDVLRPARPFPTPEGWRARGAVLFVVGNLIAFAAPLLWDERLARHRLVDATGLGVVGGAVVGLLVLELVLYWWHRALHRFDPLWRWLHQMHHSVERMDAFGALYQHPLDTAGFTLMNSVALVLLVGVRPEAAVLAVAADTLIALFTHANLKTPRWLGYLIQRPEAHCVHHERGVHAHNYSQLPLWDLVFGTFRGPAGWAGEAGFSDGASARVLDMLCGRDVTAPAVSAQAPLLAQAS